MIRGLGSKYLTTFSDARGSVHKLLTSSSQEFKGFGEAYISTIASNSVKAWRLHTLITSNITVVHGNVLVVCIQREDSDASERIVQKFLLSDKSPELITIPPGVWYGFKAGAEGGKLVNIINEEFSEDEVRRAEAESSHLSFDIANEIVPEVDA